MDSSITSMEYCLTNVSSFLWCSMYRLSLKADSHGLSGPLLLFVLIAGFWFFAQSLNPLLQYDRGLFRGDEFWRIVSAHLVHANTQHFLLNSAGLALLWILHGMHYRLPVFLGMVVLMAVSCSLMLYFFSTTTGQYLGLSGVLHGLIIWGGFRDIRAGMVTGYLLVAGAWIKVIYEQLAGPSQEAARLIGIDVAIDVHLYGAIAGTLTAIAWMAMDCASAARKSTRQDNIVGA